MKSVGTQIKEIRKANGLSLSDVAGSTGLSLGYLSKVERDLTNPTIINLHKICQVLNITMNDVFPSTGVDIYFPKSQREPMFETSEIRYDSATVSTSTLKASVLTIHNGANINSYKHDFDEIALILSGSMDIVVNGKTFTLNEGDTLFVENGSDHVMINNNEDDCISYWVKAFCVRKQDF
ncbi:MAG: helix-turn-helix domain-containing protein [Oscillospiraceae bacterium]|nr:helix-turn-helix domain-containing protein [Oscillospiraceae bacterium]